MARVKIRNGLGTELVENLEADTPTNNYSTTRNHNWIFVSNIVMGVVNGR